jgi:hemoglobin
MGIRMLVTQTRRWFAVGVCAILLSACQSMSMHGMGKTQEKSLYDRLGGQPAITAVVDDFVGNVAADARINAFFARTDIPRLKRLLVEQICQASGGPCVYTGDDMKSVHAGMHITDGNFNALVEDLKRSLDRFNVPAKEQGELLGTLGSLKPQIVGQ